MMYNLRGIITATLAESRTTDHVKSMIGKRLQKYIDQGFGNKTAPNT